MATPHFITAFDTLNPTQFSDLCTALLTPRCEGFIFLGGVGPDGGIDAEVDSGFGTWDPSSLWPLGTDIYPPNRKTLFQFKHQVTARVGQARSRDALLQYFTCDPRKVCELHKTLIVDVIKREQPVTYVVVTNVEVNSLFRDKFIKQCRAENPSIEDYRIIGLDELEQWLKLQPETAHDYFPGIFPAPRFKIRVTVERMYTYIRADGRREWKAAVDVVLDDIQANGNSVLELYRVTVRNTGQETTYIDHIELTLVIDGKVTSVTVTPGLVRDSMWGEDGDQLGGALEPGRKHIFNCSFTTLRELLPQSPVGIAIPEDIQVVDQIDNRYAVALSEDVRTRMISRP